MPTTYTPEQLAQMAAAWRQARSERYAAFRASLSAAQRDLWTSYQEAERELVRVRRWQERSRHPKGAAHNRKPPIWPEEAAPRMRRLTEQEIAALAELYQAGYSAYKIAHLTGISPQTIIGALRRNGIQMRHFTNQELSAGYHGPNEAERISQKGAPAPYKDADWLREQYEQQRKPLLQIADETGTCLRTIQHWLKRHKIPTRDHHGRDKSAEERTDA